MGSELNNAVIRRLEPPELALYFRRILTTNSEAAVSEHLLEAVKHGSVAPMIFDVWLVIAKSPSSLSDAFTQEHSLMVRKAAIKEFGKRLKGNYWRETLAGLGGTPGLVSLIDQFSVVEVQLFTKTVARYVEGYEVDEKRQRIEELLRRLLPRLFLDTPLESPDRRPLTNHYAHLALGSTSKFLATVLSNKSSPILQWLPRSFVHKYRYDLLRELSLQKILGKDNGQFELTDHLPDLLKHSRSGPSPEPGFSDSMLFSLELLRSIVRDSNAKLPKQIFLPQLVEPLLRNAIKRNVDWKRIQEIIDLAIRYLQIHNNEAGNLSFTTGSFVHRLAWCWSEHESLFQQHLVGALELVPKSHASLNEFAGIFPVVQRPLRYKFLRLCFLYAAPHQRDIDIDEGLKDVRVEEWPSTMFSELEPEHALPLLQRLRHVRNDDGFLEIPYWGDRILHLPPSPDVGYGDFDLLLAFLEQGNTEALERARHGKQYHTKSLAFTDLIKAIEERKRKAVTSRGQSDREFFAKSALFYAIASGSLQLYSETLIWARRFGRDPVH